MWCDELLRKKLVLDSLIMIKIGKLQTSKDDLNNILEPKKFPQGTHVIYRNTNDEGETYFMVAWKGKINHVKRKKLKNNFITNMLFTYCYITKPVEPGTQKRHQLCVRMDPQKIIVIIKVCKVYYNNCYTTDMINNVWLGGINIETSMQTSDCNMNLKVYILVLWS